MRKLFLLFSVVLVGLVFIARLFYLQVYNSSADSILDNVAVRKVYDYPKRGYVYDRNGKLLVANQPAYDVLVVPRELKELSQEELNELCSILKITPDDYYKRLEKAKAYSRRLASAIVTQLSKEDYAILQEKLRKYEGFYIEKRSIRLYNTSIGANVLGNTGEVNDAIIKKNSYYKLRDLIGKQGVELSYEEILRGRKGVRYIQKDKFNKNIGPFKGGIYDTIPIPGKDIAITIDADLQAYGELLMKYKRGGIIAIDPSNGEILAMVSGPSYNPNSLVGRQRSKNFNKLYLDTINKPMFDRSLQAQYPPGSPFKVINALIGLQENVININDEFSCRQGYYYGSKKLTGCHHHISPINLINGIAQSCNAYFVNVYRRIIDKYETPQEGVNVWSDHAKSFGLGNFLNNDLSVGRPGRIPSGDYYQQRLNPRWGSTYIVSNAIGQGEVEATPIQLANMVAAIANRGFYYTPHIIKSIENDTIPKRFKTKRYTTIDKQHFEPVIQGMFDVYNNGTAEYLQVPDIEICGKTGTAENFMKIEGKTTQLTDHSIFVAFAPKDDPKIALAIFVENGYWGSRFAGRMASLMIEKYLNNEITRTDLENWIFTHSLENEYAKPYSGEPFGINGESKFQVIDNYALEKPTNNNEQ